MYKWLWPGKEDWKGWLLDSKQPLRGKEANNWRTNRPQQAGDSFLPEIQKAPNRFIIALLTIAAKIFKKIRPWEIGRARVIDRIQFMRGDYSAAEYPIRWAVTMSGLRGILPSWDRGEQAESSFGENIIINLEHPEMVAHIVVEIIEPHPNKHWATEEIRIREAKLFGRFWRTDIR